MSSHCSNCCALHWLDERVRGPSDKPEFGRCCNHGKVNLPSLPDPPQELHALLTDTSPRSRAFRSHIRQYNCALAFASFTANEEDVNTNRRGPWIWKSGYTLYHSVGSFLPAQDRQPSYTQLYFYDAHDALDYRMQRNSNLDEDIMTTIQSCLRRVNPFAHVFLNAKEIIQQEDVSDLTIRLLADPKMDLRRYNVPTVDEIAVVVCQKDDSAAEPRDVILRTRSNNIQRISDLHAAYAPLHYVLLFPFGTPGWCLTLHSNSGQQCHVTQAMYYAFRLHTHENEIPSIHLGGRLFQQYICDVWVSTDLSRLRWVEENQRHLRACLYSGLEDVVSSNDDNVDLHDLGHRVILPSSYTGGPRYMNLRFQDAMALARHFHGFDIFLTMTCNPNWPEIINELLPGQSTSDRPDLVVRVFHLYKEKLLEELTEKSIIGVVQAHVHCIEFQKRGLPHMHLLLNLERLYRPLRPVDVDLLIRATWPDPNTEPRLFEIVKRCMIHGPCGSMDRNASCMKDGKCSKQYPKTFQDETLMTTDGYPIYARPDDGRKYEVRGCMLDNRWIVPYNPYIVAR